MQKITPFLWFDNQAEEAANFYVSLFKDAHIDNVQDMGGNILVVNFTLEGQQYIAMNAGPAFKFTEAISFFVDCDSQEEVDRLWSALTANGGEESQCGWLKDKYGLSWQIIPNELMQLVSDLDPERANRATQAMLKMQKIEISVLRAAVEAM